MYILYSISHPAVPLSVFLVYTRLRMSTNTLLLGVLFILMAIALIFVIRIEIRMRKLFKGSKAITLESLMADVIARVEHLGKQGELHDKHLVIHDEQIQKLGRGVKLIRFNPFPDMGGTQSFAVAIVNEKGDGVVFSSLYSRERMSVFAKPISGGKSDIELTPEEASVVAEAIEDTTKK